MKYMFVSLTLHTKQTVLWLLYLQQIDQHLAYNKPLVYIRWLILNNTKMWICKQLLKYYIKKRTTYLVIKFYLSHQNGQIMNSKWSIIVDFFIYSLTLRFRITVRNKKKRNTLKIILKYTYQFIDNKNNHIIHFFYKQTVYSFIFIDRWSKRTHDYFDMYFVALININASDISDSGKICQMLHFILILSLHLSWNE